jgi:hypothetical protein
MCYAMQQLNKYSNMCFTICQALSHLTTSPVRQAEKVLFFSFYSHLPTVLKKRVKKG